MQKRPRKYGKRYPWKRWFSLQRFRLVRGVHYDSPSYVFAQMIRNTAHFGRNGVKPCAVSIRISPDERYLDVEVKPKKEQHANPHETNERGDVDPVAGFALPASA